MAVISKQTPWAIQKSVVFGIFVRELNSRFGRFKLGYFYAVGEPVAIILFLSGVRTLLGTEDIAGLAFPVFFAAGVMVFQTFSRIANGALGAIEANLGLFNYQRVKPADVTLARVLLEALIALAAGILILVALRLLGFSFTWNNSLLLMLVSACFLLMTTGLALALSILGPLWQDSKRVIPFFIRPLFFISGVFFPATALPEEIRTYALLNPLLHFLELFRQTMFANYQSREGSISYIVMWSLLSFLFGLSIYRLYRFEVVTSGNIR